MSRPSYLLSQEQWSNASSGYEKKLGFFQKLKAKSNIKKMLNLNGQTVGDYKAELIKKRGELYGMLHNPSKQALNTMSKEEIVAKMAEIGEKLKPVYALETGQLEQYL